MQGLSLKYKNLQAALGTLQGQLSTAASSSNEVFSKAKLGGQTQIQSRNCPLLGNKLDWDFNVLAS